MRRTTTRTYLAIGSAVLLLVPMFLMGQTTQKQQQMPGRQAEPGQEMPGQEMPGQQMPGRQMEPGQQAVPNQQAQAGQFMRLQNAIGSQIANTDNSLTGRIDDFVVNGAGDIRYAVVSFQQGQSQQQAETPQQQQVAQAGAEYLVPSDRIRYQDQRFVVELRPDELQNLQTLQNGNLPQSVAMEMGSRHVLISELAQAKVMGAYDQDIGQVQGAMVDISLMRIAYVAIAPAQVLGLSSQLYAVPPSDVERFNLENKTVTMSITADQLTQYQGFNQGDWPQTLQMNPQQVPPGESGGIQPGMEGEQGAPH